MKIVVLGASGATGREVVRQALDAGHKVVAYVRRPQALGPEFGLDVRVGDIEDVAALRLAMEGAGAVISCLGPGVNLKSLRRADLMQRALPAVTAAMREAGVGRLVLMSAFGVGDTVSKASPLARFAFATALRSVYSDKLRAEAALPAAGLRVCTVYPVMLDNGPRTGNVAVLPVAAAPSVRGLPKVSRADVASVLLDRAVDLSAPDERLLITSGG